MTRKRKYVPKKTSTRKENIIDIHIMGEIVSKVERIQYGEDKTKCVFTIRSTLGNEATVVSWSNHNVRTGDKVSIEGRMNTINKHIVIWSLLIYERTKDEDRKNENDC